jgi:type I restriction enzyme S subunit
MMELIELGNECEIITKGTTPTTLGKSFTTIGVGFLRAQNVINSNVLIDEDILYIDDETHNNELKRSQIFDGDVLLTIAGTIGRTAIVKNINIQLNCNQAVAIIRLGDSKINKEYLCHFIASPNAQEQFFKGMVTATIANLSLAQIRKLKIPLPPLPQQQKIANILDAADAVRHNDKALIAKYDELTQALFLDMFGDPVSNPKGWEKEELGKVLDVRDGTHDSPKYKENGHPLVTSKNIKNGKLILDDVNYISEEDYNKINLRSKVDVGDIIMPMIGTIGNPLLVDFEVNFAIKNVALFKFKDDSIITNKMLLNLLNGHFLERFSSLNNKGGTQKFVSLGDIRKMIVPIPPLQLQNQFAERVAVVEEQKAIAQKSLEKSESLFNSLLQKAFKGELV